MAARPPGRTTMDMMKSWVDTSIGHGIWLVLVFHGIEGIGWEALTTETMRAYLDYIKEHERHMWIATFQDGAKYARERVNSMVRTNVSAEVIEVSVTHTLKPDVYDLPLTARTTIPADWRLVRFRQGEDVRWLPVSPRRRRTVRDVSNRAQRKTRAIGESRELMGSRELNAPEQNPRFRFDPVDRRFRGDIQRAIVGVAPIQIGRRFRHQDRADVMAVRIPDPDAAWPGDPDIARDIDAHAVGNTAAAFLLAEYPAVFSVPRSHQLHRRGSRASSCSSM